VPVSGHESTQLPQPIHRLALITGRGSRGSPSPAPFDTDLTAALCTFQIAMGAPQAAQKAESRDIHLPHRGQAMAGCASAICAPAEAPLACFAAGRVFKYLRTKNTVTSTVKRNVTSVSKLIPFKLAKKHQMRYAICAQDLR